MRSRRLGFAFTPTLADEAKGVTIRRAIGGERLAILDPFILLDHPVVPSGSDVVGFPKHPHRGIETLSYVILGQVAHKDSLGNSGTVGAGGAQWMTAGNGIFHEEMLIPGEEGAEFLQLWFSLPKSAKRIPASYSGADPDEVPEVAVNGGSVRVVAGSFEGVGGAFQEMAARPTILDIQLQANQSIQFSTPPGESAVVYVYRGGLTVGRQTVSAPHMIVLTDGDSFEGSAGTDGARFVYLSAKPHGEPILQYRSFVMNTVEDIAETLDMIHAGTFAKY